MNWGLLILLVFGIFLVSCYSGTEIPKQEELVVEPIEPLQSLEISEKEVVTESQVAQQITEDSPDTIRWEIMPIKYFIVNKETCGDYETRKIQRAFTEVEEATGSVVSFKEIVNKDDSNIDVSCSFIEDCYKSWVDIEREAGYIYTYTYEQICDHDAGRAKITDFEGNYIKKAEIEMIGLAGFSETTKRGTSGFFVGNCGHTTTEIHEILHTFYYKHIDDPRSIMYYAGDIIPLIIRNKGECIGSKIEIDKAIVDDLIATYS